MENIPLVEYRCSCRRLLFKGMLVRSRVEIKCRRCGGITVFGDEHRVASRSKAQYSFVLDTHNSIVAVSENVPDILGYTPDELIGKFITDVLPYVRENNVQQWPRNAGRLENGNVAFESVHKSKRGTRVPVRAHVTPAPVGDACFALYVFEVMPERYAATTPVVHDRLRRDGFIPHDLLMQVNGDGVVIYVSTAWARLFAKNGFSLLGRSLFELFKKPEQHCYAKCFKEMCDTRNAYSIDFASFDDTDGVPHQLRLHHSPIYHDDGSLSGYTIVGERTLSR